MKVIESEKTFNGKPVHFLVGSIFEETSEWEEYFEQLGAFIYNDEKYVFDSQIKVFDERVVLKVLSTLKDLNGSGCEVDSEEVVVDG